MEVRLPAKPMFVGCRHQCAVNPAVVEVSCMRQCSWPILCRKGGAVEKRASGDREGVIPFLGARIFRWAVSFCRFNDVEVLFQSHCLECSGASKFATLIAADNTTGATAIHLKEMGYQVGGGVL